MVPTILVDASFPQKDWLARMPDSANGSSCNDGCEPPDDEHVRTAIPLAAIAAGARGGDATSCDRRVRSTSSMGFLQCRDSGKACASTENEVIRPDGKSSVGWFGVPRLEVDSNNNGGVSLFADLPQACQSVESGGKAASASGAQQVPKKSSKCRTLKYFPPPADDKDPISVDVIDHGSEVLIVRRDPSPLRSTDQASQISAVTATSAALSLGSASTIPMAPIRTVDTERSLSRNQNHDEATL